MDDQQTRLTRIEGQIEALTKAWLYLAAQIEIRGQLDPEKMERGLLNARWADAPFERHAQHLMQHLADELADARETRWTQELYRRTGRDE